MSTVAFMAAVIGAVGSLGLLLSVGQRAPLFLLVLFIGWDLSPFIALIWANRASQRWSYGLTLAITVVSLAIYANAVVLNPTGKTPTATFLLVPLGCWLLIAIAWGIVRFRKGD